VNRESLSAPARAFPRKTSTYQRANLLEATCVTAAAKKVSLRFILSFRRKLTALGHWIQACPTNDDPNFEGKARIKRTTGIPRSMLKTIDKSELENLDEATRQQMMINGDGEYVIAQTDEKEWKKHQERVKASAAAQERANKGDQELQSRGLECPIDKRLFVDPVKTPCCQRTYCNECISTALIDSDLTCPSCSTENVTLEEVVPDTETQLKVDAYKAEKAAEKKHDDESKSVASSPCVKGAKTVKSAASSRSGSKSPISGSTEDKVGSKKRGADAISDSKTLVPTAPEMKRQRSGESATSSKPSPQKPNSTPVIPDMTSTPTLPLSQMMPPDMSQMMQGMGNQNMNFPMPMPGMPFMPNMNMNMMNPGMMGMPGNFMPPNFNMNGMNGGMNGPGGVNFMNGMNFPPHQPNGTFHHPPNPTMNGNNFGQPTMYPNHHNQQSNNQMPRVPTGPRNANIPTGPSNANIFSNQQRHLGNEEDNAYMRQPVNPHRHQNRQRRVRPSDYRELGLK
jgi:protein MPE1